MIHQMRLSVVVVALGTFPNHKKHRATGGLLHLSRDRGGISVGSLRSPAIGLEMPERFMHACQHQYISSPQCFPLENTKSPPTPKILENYSKITIWPTPGTVLSPGVPKGPSHTKNTTDTKFTIHSQLATAIVKHYGGHFETTIFKGKLSSKLLQIVKNYGSSKTLRN